MTPCPQLGLVLCLYLYSGDNWLQWLPVKAHAEILSELCCSVKFLLKQWPPNMLVWETGPFRHIQLCPACSRRQLVLVSSLSTWYNPESLGRVLVAGGRGGGWGIILSVSSSGNLTLNVGSTMSLTGPWHVYGKRMLAESSRWAPVYLFPPCTCRHDALKVLVLASPQWWTLT